MSDIGISQESQKLSATLLNELLADEFILFTQTLIPKIIQKSRFFGCWRLKFASGEAVAESAVYLKTK